jgi:hypothetical protein
MRIFFKQKAGRSGMAWGWSSPIMGLTKALVGIFFLAMLHGPVPVLGVTLPGSYNVTLAWNPSPDPNIAGYCVYYGSASGNYTNSVMVGNVTTNTVSGLASGVTYYFAVTAYDTNGEQSAFSSEIDYMPGVPTVGVSGASAGQFVLTVSGLIGGTYEIEATQDFMTWTIISTVTVGSGGSLDFTDTNAAGFPQRFYRTQQTP